MRNLEENLKSYKEFDQEVIGDSDIASLIMIGIGMDGLRTQVLEFNQDGRYHAYIVKGKAKIGKHYRKVAEFNSWMKIYDDDTCTGSFKAEKILVYRSGEFGCIIQLLEAKDLLVTKRSTRLEEMTNLYVGINNSGFFPFRVAIVADNMDAAQRIVDEYALDSGIDSPFVVTDQIADGRFDCDYILTDLQKHF